MNASIKNMTGSPTGILSAMIVTAFLFVTLPLLNQFKPSPSTRTNSEPVFIDKLKPSPPLPAEREETKKQSMLQKKRIENTVKPARVQPKIDIPRGNLLTDISNGIEIVISPTVQDIPPISELTYRPEEVDQTPRLLRSFPPQYPYLARRDNIEGWVVLRFVVDTDGIPEKIEIVEGEPAGIFEEAATEAVARYKFKPAMKNGEGVNCIIKQRISFTLD